MKLNKKNIITIILFAGLLVPFILLTDIFPFMRFGMFAEPVRVELTTEKFLIYKTTDTGLKTVLQPEETGINPNTFHYLCRNYVYRNETKVFAEKLFSITGPSVASLDIFKIVQHQAAQPDTITIGSYTRK